MKLILVVFISLVVAAAMASDDDWEAYKKKFNKTYETAEEDARRKELYQNNVKEVEEHNKKYATGEVSFSKGVNQFSDWTTEEFQKLHGSRIPTKP